MALRLGADVLMDQRLVPKRQEDKAPASESLTLGITGCCKMTLVRYSQVYAGMVMYHRCYLLSAWTSGITGARLPRTCSSSLHKSWMIGHKPFKPTLCAPRQCCHHQTSSNTLLVIALDIFASPKHWATLNINEAHLGNPLQRPSLDACLEAETNMVSNGFHIFWGHRHVQSTMRMQRKEIIPQRVTRSPCTRFYGLASSNLSSSNFKGPTFRWGRNSSAWQFGSGICEQMRGIWIELNKSQMLHMTFTSTKRGPGWTWKLQLLQSAAIGLQAGLQHSGIRWAGSFTTQEQLLHTCRKTSSVCAFLNPTSTLFNARNV